MSTQAVTPTASTTQPVGGGPAIVVPPGKLLSSLPCVGLVDF